MPHPDVTGANLPGMTDGVTHFMDLKVPLERHSSAVHGTFERYPNIGGNGQFGQAMDASYYPAAKASAKFLAGIVDLTDVNGGKTIDLTHLFEDTNDSATNQVSGLDPNVVGPTHVV